MDKLSKGEQIQRRQYFENYGLNVKQPRKERQELKVNLNSEEESLENHANS